MLKQVIALSLVAFSFVLGSCGNSKVATVEGKTKETKVEETNQNSKMPSEISARIVEMSKDFTSDPVTVIDAHIDGNLLSFDGAIFGWLRKTYLRSVGFSCDYEITSSTAPGVNHPSQQRRQLSRAHHRRTDG
jgi:hypothetical protein